MSAELFGSQDLAWVRLAENVKIADASSHKVIQEAVRAQEEASIAGEGLVVTALHVGGLNCIGDGAFLAALDRSRLVYADGMAVVALARLSGARNIQRAATTDIGISILEGVSARLGRRIRLALVGGPPSLAARAGLALEAVSNVDVVYSTDGFKSETEWELALGDLKSSRPDVVLLGLGSPNELLFADRHIAKFPPALVLTCGGWFGFLVGEEPRAHPLLRKCGLEWVGRLLHDPSRLARRYARGAITTFNLSCDIALRRIGVRS